MLIFDIWSQDDSWNSLFQKSILQVKDLINEKKPTAIFLELSTDRKDSAEDPDSEFWMAVKEGERYNADIIMGDMSEQVAKLFIIVVIVFYSNLSYHFLNFIFLISGDNERNLLPHDWVWEVSLRVHVQAI